MDFSKLYSDLNLAVIGLGYVGLPLAVKFGELLPVIGFDIDSERIDQLKKGEDRTNELTSADLHRASKLEYTSEGNRLSSANCFIVTVPTPIDEDKIPDLQPLRSASTLVGSFLKKGDVVIFESTVFPGCTEEVCVPLLESMSGLEYGNDFICGYSPERINPGDRERTVSDICKIISASTSEGLDFLDWLYGKIITAGLHRAENIKVAEAAKIIENTQRDINIALMNELAVLFSKLDIDTHNVLRAAGTKWNFSPFKPGLVGGHCIGVDPYYLTHKAKLVGYMPQMILAGRRINEDMSRFVTAQLIKRLAQREEGVVAPHVLILGYTFKENCPDVRNTKVRDVIEHLRQYNCKVSVFDPHIEENILAELDGVTHLDSLVEGEFDAILVAVAHKEFSNFSGGYLRSLSSKKCVIYDLKNILPLEDVDMRL